MADSPTLAPSRTNRRVRSQRTFEEHYRDLRRADSNTSSLFPDGRRESELPGRAKLGTFAGVFVPTILSIWGVLYYLRFGYVVGQGGVVGTLLVWAAAHVVSIVTALSLSAICTAGVVKTGGVYYILSRVLGPEFGGSLGVYLVLSNVLSAALAALAFVESLLDNFGSANGGFLPDGRWWTLLYATILNFASAAVCFVGADSFAKTSVFLATILLVSTLSCYATFLFRAPFQNPEMHLNFTGIRMETLESNLWPDFHPDDEGNPVGYTTLFGLLFPIVAGVLSGASLSGDLESPSKSIPRGTLSAIAFTLFIYVTTTFLLASTVTRASLLKDLSVVVDANFFPATVTAGLLATSIFACLGSIISAAKAWQALARDHLIPGISVFAYGDLTNDEPHLATAFCTLLTQLLLMTVTDINVLAPLVTITNLILFSGVNLAVALLKLASAPNFRPSFRYFSFGQALFGTVACIVAIVLVDPGYGLVSILIEIVLFFVIAYSAAPKPWGDVSQGIIFHQVRKYLLQLDLNRTHTKFWRPQILLCVDTPLKDVNLVKFGNQLKKGGLYVLAHVYPTEDFRGTVAALQDVNYTWLKYVEQLHVKAFVELSSAPTVRLGIQSLMMTAGLGTLKPNLVMLRWPSKDLDDPAPSDSNSSVEVSDDLARLPTVRSAVSPQEWVAILEDINAASKITCIARNFANLDRRVTERVSKLASLWRSVRPLSSSSVDEEASPLLPSLPLKGGSDKLTVHVWPVQSADGEAFESVTTVLQLASILSRTDQWERTNFVAYAVVEAKEDGPAEVARLSKLIDDLRIDTHVVAAYACDSPSFQRLLAERSRNSRSARPNQDSWGFRISTRSPIGFFAELSGDEQCQILNDLMLEHSSGASLLLSTFASPPPGTSASPESAASYVAALDTLTADLRVPLLLTSSPELVVTMAL